jgi:hypothetical protein
MTRIAQRMGHVAAAAARARDALDSHERDVVFVSLQQIKTHGEEIAKDLCESAQRVNRLLNGVKAHG